MNNGPSLALKMSKVVKSYQSYQERPKISQIHPKDFSTAYKAN